MDKIALSSNQHEIDIFTDLGLKLTFRPFHLLKESIGSGSQEVLDKLVETGYRKVLNDFSKWHKKIFSGKLPKDQKFLEEKYREEIVMEVFNLACYGRDILFLHSDHESIELNEAEKEAERNAYELWRYNKLYGFKEVAERKKEIENIPLQEKAKVIKQVTQPVIQQQPVNQQNNPQNQQQNHNYPKHYKNPDSIMPESVNLQPQENVELGTDGLPLWFIDGLRITAIAMASGNPAEAIGWLLNISIKKGSESVFGQPQISEWLQKQLGQK
jgi:hypothetical protein